MRTVPLGRTGRAVSAVGMGAMPLSFFDARPSRRDAIAVVHAALDAGVTLFDTADSYCLHAGEMGHNERLLRDALASHPVGPTALVATKGGIARDGRRMRIDARPWHLRRACESSLAALGVETIELYQLHAPDTLVPFAESVGALGDLQREGKIRRIGLSNVTPDHLREARGVAEIASVQNRFNPWDRSAERSGLLDACARDGIAFLAHSPLGGADLVARLRQSPALAEAGRGNGASGTELVLAWIAAKGAVPIPGASRAESVRSTARAGDLRLGGDAVAELERALDETCGQGRAAATAA